MFKGKQNLNRFKLPVLTEDILLSLRATSATFTLAICSLWKHEYIRTF